MKRIVFLFFALSCMFTSFASVCSLEELSLIAERIKNDGSGNDYPRGLVYVPSVSIDDHTFYINESHPDYVLQLVDPDDETNVVYEISMPAGVNSVILPSSLNGEFIIQLIWGDWRFWGYIELE